MISAKVRKKIEFRIYGFEKVAGGIRSKSTNIIRLLKIRL